MPVVGGSPAEPCEHPSTVSITYDDGEPFCTGTLIGERVVVTAAHCLDDGWGEAVPADGVRVVVGLATPATASMDQQRTVASLVMHPDYDPYPPLDGYGMGASNDIGVMVLEQRVTEAPATAILPADAIPTVLVPGSWFEISGFGVYEYSGNPDDPGPDGRLFRAELEYRAHSDSELLAGSFTGADTCFGDSGGPAYFVDDQGQWLVGATSRAGAMTTTDCGEETVFSLVPSHRSWIESAAALPLATVPAQSTCVGTGGSGPDGWPDLPGWQSGDDSADDSDGCGCRMPRRGDRPGSGWLALVGAALAGRVRRRSGLPRDCHHDRS